MLASNKVAFFLPVKELLPLVSVGQAVLGFKVQAQQIRTPMSADSSMQGSFDTSFRLHVNLMLTYFALWSEKSRGSEMGFCHGHWWTAHARLQC